MLGVRRPSINSAPSPLSKSIMNDRWDEAINIARNQPDKAKIWGMRQGFFEGLKDSTVLPLHECLVANGPVELVQAIIYAYPKGVQQKESSYQRLPLHCACRKNANPKVIQLLLEADAEAALVADSLGRLPRKSTGGLLLLWKNLSDLCVSLDVICPLNNFNSLQSIMLCQTALTMR